MTTPTNSHHFSVSIYSKSHGFDHKSFNTTPSLLTFFLVEAAFSLPVLLCVHIQTTLFQLRFRARHYELRPTSPIRSNLIFIIHKLTPASVILLTHSSSSNRLDHQDCSSLRPSPRTSPSSSLVSNPRQLQSLRLGIPPRSNSPLRSSLLYSSSNNMPSSSNSPHKSTVDSSRPHSACFEATKTFKERRTFGKSESVQEYSYTLHL